MSNQAMLNPTTEQFTYKRWMETHVAVLDELSAEETRAKFAEFEAHEADLCADLMTRKVDALRRFAVRLGIFTRATRKAGIVEDLLEHMARSYVPGVVSFFLGSKTMREAIRERVLALTDEELKASRDERNERRAEREKAVTNPETLQEFHRFVAVRGEGALSLEQGERWDDLRAKEARSARADKAARETRSEVVVPVTGLVVQEGWHAKKQRATFVVALPNKVDRAIYDDLLGKAKGLGGYYSSFRGSGAVPGFQFDSPDDAQTFCTMAGGAKPDAADLLGAELEWAGASGLVVQAARMRERAEAALAGDRLTNTAKRVRQALSTEANARAELAMASTLEALAVAASEGRLGHLAGVRHRTQVEVLESALRGARSRRLRTLEAGQQREALDGVPLGRDDVAFAEYPWPYVHKSTLKSLLVGLRERPGSIRLSALVEKCLAETAADDWGWHAKAGDVEVLLDFIAKARAARLDKWNVECLERSVASCKRLAAADIRSLAELRAALREYLSLRAPPAESDALREAELALVGRPIKGFFPTPPSVTAMMLEAADVQEGNRVLDPSAGKGDLLDAVMAAQPGAIREAVEINESLAGIVDLKGHAVAHGDFLAWEPSAPYDRVLMNPPFENGQDIIHVRKAFRHVAPGGRLVAVMSEGPFYRDDRESVAFREWLESVGGQSQKLPDGSFAGRDAFRRTSVATRLVVIEAERAIDGSLVAGVVQEAVEA